MKIDCKIKSILEPRSGVKEEKQWYLQPIVVEWQESKTRNDGTIYAVDQSLMIELTGEKAKNFTLPVGTNVTVDVRFETHEYLGRTYNGVRCGFIILR